MPSTEGSDAGLRPADTSPAATLVVPPIEASWAGKLRATDEELDALFARRRAPIIVCTTDSAACTCRAPKDTPAGMHHDDCPTNPASRLTGEQRAWIERRPAETDREWINRMRVGNGRAPIDWED